MKNVPSNSHAFISYIFLMGSRQRDASKYVLNPSSPRMHTTYLPLFVPNKISCALTCTAWLLGWYFRVVPIYVSDFSSAAHLIAASATSCKGTSALNVSKLLPGKYLDSVHRTKDSNTPYPPCLLPRSYFRLDHRHPSYRSGNNTATGLPDPRCLPLLLLLGGRNLLAILSLKVQVDWFRTWA